MLWSQMDSMRPVGQSEQRIGVINAGINDADHDTAPGSTQGGLIKYRSYAAAFQGSRVLEPIELGDRGVCVAGDADWLDQV